MTEQLEGAISLATIGCKIIPVYGLVKRLNALICECGNPECEKPGKHPRLKGWQNKGTTDISAIQNWAKRYPNGNFGMPTGNGIVVLDVDGETGKQTLRDLEAKYGRLPKTVTAITGGGGYHFYFRSFADIHNSVCSVGPKLDIRAWHGQVVIPGSLHVSGKRYEWEILGSPEEVKIADLPPWLERLALGSEKGSSSPGAGEKTGAALTNSTDLIPDGERNTDLFKIGCNLRGQKGYTMDRVREELYRINAERCNPPKPDSVIETLIRQIDQYPRGGGADQAFTPEGLVSFADVEYEEPRFLIKPYLPIGKLTMLQGDPGQGKTAFLCKIAALVSRGDPLIDIPVESGNVLLLSVEDDPGTLRGRIEASGGDATKCFFINEAYKLSFESLDGLEILATENNIKLIAFDPIQAFLGRGMDMNKANETRPVLAELAAMADRIGCAVLLIAHMNKGRKEEQAVYRALGSVDIVGAMRSGLQVATHILHPGKVFVFQYKSSNAAAGSTIEFSIGDRGGVSLSGFSALKEKDFRTQDNGRLQQRIAKMVEPGAMIDACQKVLDEHPNGILVRYTDLDFEWPDETNPWTIIAACRGALSANGIYVEGPKKKNGNGAVLIQPMRNREGAGL